MLHARIESAEVEKAIGEIVDRAADFRPVFRGPIDALSTEILRQQFESRGAALTGARWAPLSPTTIALRTRRVRVNSTSGRASKRGDAWASTNRVGQARFGFAEPLRNTGRLFASFVKPGGPEGVRVIEPLEYVRGSRVRYAALHQTGFMISRIFGRPLRAPVRVPARPILPDRLPDAVTNRYEQALLAYWLEGRTA